MGTTVTFLTGMEGCGKSTRAQMLGRRVEGSTLLMTVATASMSTLFEPFGLASVLRETDKALVIEEYNNSRAHQEKIEALAKAETWFLNRRGLDPKELKPVPLIVCVVAGRRAPEGGLSTTEIAYESEQ